MQQDDECGHTVTECFESFGRQGMQEGEQEGSSTTPPLPRQNTNKNQPYAIGMARSVISFKPNGFLNLDVKQWQVRNKVAAGRVLS